MKEFNSSSSLQLLKINSTIIFQEFCIVFKNIFLQEHLLLTTSARYWLVLVSMETSFWFCNLNKINLWFYLNHTWLFSFPEKSPNISKPSFQQNIAKRLFSVIDWLIKLNLVRNFWYPIFMVESKECFRNITWKLFMHIVWE